MLFVLGDVDDILMCSRNTRGSEDDYAIVLYIMDRKRPSKPEYRYTVFVAMWL